MVNLRSLPIQSGQIGGFHSYHIRQIVVGLYGLRLAVIRDGRAQLHDHGASATEYFSRLFDHICMMRVQQQLSAFRQ